MMRWAKSLLATTSIRLWVIPRRYFRASKIEQSMIPQMYFSLP